MARDPTLLTDEQWPSSCENPSRTTSSGIPSRPFPRAARPTLCAADPHLRNSRPLLPTRKFRQTPPNSANLSHLACPRPAALQSSS